MKYLICFLVLVCVIFAKQPNITNAIQIFEKLDKVNVPLETYFQIASVKHSPISFKKFDMVPIIKEEDYIKAQDKAHHVGGKVVKQLSDSNAINWGLVINTAEKVWDFVQKNKAVADYQKHFANVLPKGVSSMWDMEFWSAPKTASYHVKFKNLLGITVLDFQYTVSFRYNGSYNGKGKYLNNITILPNTVSVAWGYTFTATVSIPDGAIANIGSKDNPVASAQIDLNYKIKALNSIEKYESFYVTGDGQFRQTKAF